MKIKSPKFNTGNKATDRATSEIVEGLNAVLSAGGTITLQTYTRATRYTAKHAGWFLTDAAGRIRVKRGKTSDIIAHADGIALVRVTGTVPAGAEVVA